MLLLSIGSASAIQIGNLIGDWSGEIIAKEEGEIAHQDSFTIKGIRRADGGVTLIQTNKVGSVSKHQFYKDGKFRMNEGVVSSVVVRMRCQLGRLSRIQWRNIRLHHRSVVPP